MSRIRGKDTTPEKIVRSLLHHFGYRFRLHVRIPIEVGLAVPSGPSGSRPRRGAVSSPRPTFARPDILFQKHKTAIFIHGCFWHRHRGCKNCTTPTNRREWWVAKLEGNATRDKVHQRALRKLGWRSIVVWECQTENPKRLERLVAAFTRRKLPPVQPGIQSLPAMHEHPIEQARPLRIARVQRIVGKFAGICSAHCFANGLSPGLRLRIP